MAKKPFILFLLFISIGSLWAEKPTVQAPIVFGVILPLSGPLASYGQNSKIAMEVALKEINDKGGVNGTPLELRFYDDEMNVSKTKEIFSKLGAMKEIGLIIGPLTSLNVLAIGPLTTTMRKILITPTASNKTVTSGFPFVFRACFPDPFQGEVMADFIKFTLHKERILLITNQNDSYSQDISYGFRNRCEAHRLKQLKEIIIDGSVITVDTQIEEIRKFAPEIIVFLGEMSLAQGTFKSLKEAGIEAQILGPDEWDQDNINPVMEGAYFITHFSKESPGQNTQALIQKFKTAGSEFYPMVSALSYDSIYIAVEGIKKAGTIEPLALRKVLSQLTGNFLTGKYIYPDMNDPQKSAFICRFTNDSDGQIRAHYYATYDPESALVK